MTTTTALRGNRIYRDNSFSRNLDSPVKLTKTPLRTTSIDIESRRSVFAKNIQENTKQKTVKNNLHRPINTGQTINGATETQVQPPKASLLKYEVRKLVDLRKVSDNFTTNSNKDSLQQKKVETKELNNNTKLTSTIKKETMTNICEYCDELKTKLKAMEREKQSNEIKFLQLEKQLNESISERHNFSKTIKKLQREITKVESSLSEEKMQTRRLGVKLEDANYEIGRLRAELINCQLENEKVVEENEDLAVDNEDLIHERDEIVQIYDELFRESERLKHEVKIWKTVFENNKDNLPNDVQHGIEEEEQAKLNGEKEDVSDEDEGIVMEIEEDKSLLLPHRDDIILKTADPTKFFDIGEELKRGKFGKVYKVVAKSSDDVYAAKYIKVTSKLREDVLNTIEVMKKIHHQRLMNLFDVYDLGAQIVMILEFVSGGMLFERIVENNRHTEAESILYVQQILQGLHHLHVQNICHLELKPENVVCLNKKAMDIKLIDFGLAKQLDHKKEIKITAGSPEFVAPEILSFDPVSLGSDMWSVGVLAYVLLSGVSPFIGDDDNDTLLNVSCGEYEFDDSAFKRISNEAKDLIQKLLVANPRKRLTVSQCLNHPWMKMTSQTRKTSINLEKMKCFLENRKEKHNVSAVRAIRRFSSFGVGPGKLNQRGGSPIMKAGSSRHLAVPNALQSSIIKEDEEQEREENNNVVFINGPTVKITPDSSGIAQNDRSRTDSTASIPEDTNTPDGLRQYLQRMINEGHLPGGNGAPQLEDSEEE